MQYFRNTFERLLPEQPRAFEIDETVIFTVRTVLKSVPLFIIKEADLSIRMKQTDPFRQIPVVFVVPDEDQLRLISVIKRPDNGVA